MPPKPVYLDYNATTPLLPEVVDAMLPFLREHFGNPSSAHSYGRAARTAVDQARGEVAALLNCEADEIVFTSGGTEANNLAILGSRNGARRGVVTSVIEHPATSGPVSFLEQAGFKVTRVAVDAMGQVRVGELANAIDQSTALVSLMHSNNETGVLQPIREAAICARRSMAFIHTDAAQSVGKVPIDVRDLDVDFLSVAGHKLYAPKGVGALYVRRGISTAPHTLGAGHERGVRPGTENVASIVGLGVACVAARRDLEHEPHRVRGLRDRLWALLSAAVPGIALNGHPTARLPNTLNFRFPNVSGAVLLSRAPGIAAATGSACHAGHEEPSGTLLSMGMSPEQALGSVRLSLGRQTTLADVENAVALLSTAWTELRRPGLVQSVVAG